MCWLDFWRITQEILTYHRGKVLGITLGLIFGWFAISYGFFKAVFVTICIFLGFMIGKRVDESKDVKKVFERFFGPR